MEYSSDSEQSVMSVVAEDDAYKSEEDDQCEGNGQGRQWACFPSREVPIKKFKSGTFHDPQIKELVKEPMFDEILSEDEQSAWLSLKSVVKNFLRNHRSVEYEKEIEELLKNFRLLGARMSVKGLFLQSHLDYFTKNGGNVSEELGERFHLDIHIMEESNQGRWYVNFLADNCWSLKRDAVAAEYWGKSLKRSFIHK